MSAADRVGIGLKGRRNGTGWVACCPCPTHGKNGGDHSPSLSVADGKKGRLLLKCFARCKFLDILDALRRRGLVDDGPKLDRARRALGRVDPTPTAHEPDAAALQIWRATRPATDPVVAKYLASRQLALPDRHEEVLRFHPSCPFGPGVRLPCMVGLYRDIRTNEPKAIHRTALTPDGKKIDRKALGPKGGCAIKLSGDQDVTIGLSVAEGIETALAGMALNFRPMWALGDASEVAKFPLLSGIECLTILVDNDASGTGQASALECSRRWTSAGGEVFRVVPAAVGQDMADIIRGRAA
jgi:putative DNA primase/helicase